VISALTSLLVFILLDCIIPFIVNKGRSDLVYYGPLKRSGKSLTVPFFSSFSFLLLHTDLPERPHVKDIMAL